MDTNHSKNPPADDVVKSQAVGKKQGGWITFPFLTGAMVGFLLATDGATSNIMVYLIKEFNVKSIDAAQIKNFINGCTSLAPIAGAIISDSFFGCFPVIAVSTFISFLSMVLFTLTATVPSLRPTPCATGSGPCEPPSTAQLAVLYAAVGFLSIATGGTRFNLITMGADQFNKTKDQDVFFNWYLVIMYTSSIIGATVIVYVQDSVSWGLGFGLCLVANAAGLVALMMGTRYYRRPKPRGSPFTGLARVIVAAIKKRKIDQGEEGLNYYCETVEGVKSMPQAPTPSFRWLHWSIALYIEGLFLEGCVGDALSQLRFLNRAAVITEGDTNADSSIAKPWRLCAVSQVEDLKILLRISPLWTSSVFLSMSIGIQGSLAVLQALTMDRSLGPRFSVPAGSVIVFVLATVALVLPLIDRILIPLCRYLTSWTPTALHRLGLGHLLNTAAMAISALVERRRAGIVHAHHASGNPNWTVPMSVMWLLLPLAATGLAEAMHFPAQMALYYQEFPTSLRSTAAGMVALHIAIGFYTSTPVVGAVRRLTGWLPDNVNEGKMANVFWMLTVVGAVNFGYYLLCAMLYKNQSRESRETRRKLEA